MCRLYRYVKEADKDIIKHLRNVGRLIDSSNYTHSYPFCWRSDTPLIQRVGLIGLVSSLNGLQWADCQLASSSISSMVFTTSSSGVRTLACGHTALTDT